jgi:hypothetical protein
MLIREETIGDNQAGRGGCLLPSPYTGAIYYVTVEHGWVVVKDWGKAEKARERQDRCVMADPKVSACFAHQHAIIVHVQGFHAGTSDSASQTFELDTQEGL